MDVLEKLKYVQQKGNGHAHSVESVITMNLKKAGTLRINLLDKIAIISYDGKRS